MKQANCKKKQTTVKNFILNQENRFQIKKLLLQEEKYISSGCFNNPESVEPDLRCSKRKTVARS